MGYIPFLKFKVNEIGALKELEKSNANMLTPFFDLPRADNQDSETLKETIDKAYRKYELNLKQIPCFYLDNFDINDNIKIDNDDNYQYLISKFHNSPMIPVVSIDRSDRRNEIVIQGKNSGIIRSDIVAIRFCPEDFESYLIVEDEIHDLINPLLDLFSEMHLIIDNRVCTGVDHSFRAKMAIDFINEIKNNFDFSKTIITGSSIPSVISDLTLPKTKKTFPRDEIIIFNEIAQEDKSVILGDYTTVSPLYSDVKLKPEMIRKVTAPKIFYSFDEKTYIARGGSLDSHPRGGKQYDDLCEELVAQSFFRNQYYSFGDKYIYEKSKGRGPNTTPSTIPKILINAHITFMLSSF